MKITFTKITFSLAILCTMLTAQAAWEITSTSGSTFQVSDGTWTLKCQTSGSEGDFFITGFVSSADADIDLIALNSDIDTPEKNYSLTKITQKAFRNAAIKNITFPKTLKVIEQYAFNPEKTENYITGEVFIEEGSELTTITYQAFQKAQLTKINLDACTKLESIGNYAFASCSKLTTIGTGILPNTLKTLGTGAFTECSLLSNDISCNSPLDFSGGSHFKKTSVTSICFPNVFGVIGPYFCAEAKQLTNVVLSSKITKFDIQVFQSCTSLKTFYPEKLPNITYIGNYAFGSTALTTPLNFKNATFTALTGQAFSSCNDLPEIHLPATLTQITDYVFKLIKDCDFYFYGLPPTVGAGSLQNFDGYCRGNILVLEENVTAWTNNTVSGYSFTPLSEVLDSEKTDTYQYPKEGRIIGKIAVGTAPVGTHWVSLMPVVGTIILIQ